METVRVADDADATRDAEAGRRHAGADILRPIILHQRAEVIDPRRAASESDPMAMYPTPSVA